MDRWANLRGELNGFFEGPACPNTSRYTQLFNGWTPALDVYQTTDDVVAVVEPPGMRKEDIEIYRHDGMLTIGGECKDETTEGEKTTRAGRFVGKFRRSVSLPTRVETNKVIAAYKDGILMVTLPKAEEAKPKQIQVNVS